MKIGDTIERTFKNKLETHIFTGVITSENEDFFIAEGSSKITKGDKTKTMHNTSVVLERE